MSWVHPLVRVSVCRSRPARAGHRTECRRYSRGVYGATEVHLAVELN